MLMGRFSRAGAVGFVVVWAAATLTMTAASLDSGPRPSGQTESIDIDAEPRADVDSAATPTIRPPTTTLAEPPPAASTATSTTTPSPQHLAAPSSKAVVVTEVLPSIATAAQPVTAQPDFTG